MYRVLPETAEWVAGRNTDDIAAQLRSLTENYNFIG